MTEDANGLSREQVEALAEVAWRHWWAPGQPTDVTSHEAFLPLAEHFAPTVAAMLTEARAEVVRDVREVPIINPPDRYRVHAVLDGYMPSAVREGGTERPGADGRTEPDRCCPGHGTMAHVRGCIHHPEAHRETCGEALGDMRCQLRRGHDGAHEDYSGLVR